MKHLKIKHFKWFFKAAFSAALLWVILQWIGLEALGAVFKPSLAPWILASLGVYLLSQWFSAIRWFQLARALSDQVGQTASIARFWGWYLLGMFCGLFLPSALGGDAGRVLWLSRFSGIQKRSAFLSILAERGVGFVSMLWLGAILIALPGMRQNVSDATTLSILGFAALSLLGWGALLLMRHARFWQKMQRHPLGAWLAASETLWSNPRLMAETLLLSFSVNACMGVILMMLAHGLNQHISWSVLLMAFVASSLASILPLSLNGLGVREGAMVLVLTLYGVDRASAAALSVACLAVSTLTSLLGGVFWPLGFSKSEAIQAEAIQAYSSSDVMQAASRSASAISLEAC